MLGPFLCLGVRVSRRDKGATRARWIVRNGTGNKGAAAPEQGAQSRAREGRQRPSTATKSRTLLGVTVL